MKSLVVFLFIVISFQNGFAQITEIEAHELDSLYHEVTTSKQDTCIASSLVSMSEILYFYNVDTVLLLCNKAVTICEKKLKSTKISKTELTTLKGIQAAAFNNIGAVYGSHGDMIKQLEYTERSLKIREGLGDKKALATTLNNLGYSYKVLGNYKKAIEYYDRSIKIKDEIGAKKGLCSSLLNLGSLYESQYEIDKALEYYQKVLVIEKEIDNPQLRGIALNNIAYVYHQKRDFNQCFDYNFKSLKIRQEIQDKKGIANSYHNIALAYKEIGKPDSALANYQISLAMKEQQRDLFAIPPTLTSIGYLWYELGNIQKAKQFAIRSYNLSKETKVTHHIMKSSQLLEQIYSKERNFEKAYEFTNLFHHLQDSLENEDIKKAALKQNMQYEYDKKAATDSIAFAKENEVKEAQIFQQKAEIKAKQNQQIALYGGLILVIVFAGFMYNRFKVTQKQKIVIEEQKAIVESSHHLLEEKNQEITDSIRYAKRIQSAILPPTKLWKEFLPQSFILYKPKDIVAGDFYWMETIKRDELRGVSSEENGSTPNTHHSSLILFAAADCTGHGVPGAMVSVVCNNGLNRSVREHRLTDPAEILNKTREIVIEEFEKSDEEVKDGMDIAICSLSTVSSSSGAYRELKYAGANNPLWIVRNGEILETKADKQPIGKYAEQNPFTTHSFDLVPNDSIYIFTDGFHDQFGGEKGKKFKASQMKELILSIQEKNMDEQKDIIDSSFEQWKGNLEQVDDVCVIGIKV